MLEYIDKCHTLFDNERMRFKSPRYEFSEDKNQLLIKERNISFKKIIVALNNGKLLDTIDHYNVTKYPNQKIYIVEVDDYVYLVPFVRQDKQTVFLKTIIPSRKLTKDYLGKKRGST